MTAVTRMSSEASGVIKSEKAKKKKRRSHLGVGFFGGSSGGVFFQAMDF